MTSSEINVQIFRDMAEIADNEKLMKQLSKYLKKLVAKKNDPTEMTKEEFFKHIEDAEAQYARGEYTTQLPGESLSDMLKRCGYAV